ncbi:MAG: adenine deaminase, partial [Firmicutes bacterium]|nr:adenine deaminase [Bacillota bacterium]
MWQSNLIDTALGRTPPDLYLQGGTVVNVYSGEIYPADIAVKDGRIAYVGKDLGAAQPAGCTVIDARGCNLLPGFIEPHGHPAQFHDTVEYTRAASQNGITAVVSDSYKLLKALGPQEFARYIEEIKKSTPVKVYWFLRIFTEYYFSSGEPLVSPEEMQVLVNLPQVLSIGETTRWPEILQKEAFPLEAIRMIRAAGKRPDGHTAGAAGKKLAALAAAGISGCHESVTAEEVMERLRNGMHVTLRHSSQRPDLDNFLSILRDKKADLSRFMLTTDGTSPAFPDQDWNIAVLAERLIEKGIDPLTAIRMITLNPASYYRIDHEIGSLAPGRTADIVVTEGFNLSRPRMVLIDGKVVYNREATAAENKAHFKSSPLAGASKTYFACDWRVTADLFAVPALEGKKDGKEEK